MRGARQRRWCARTTHAVTRRWTSCWSLRSSVISPHSPPWLATAVAAAAEAVAAAAAATAAAAEAAESAAAAAAAESAAAAAAAAAAVAAAAAAVCSFLRHRGPPGCT